MMSGPHRIPRLRTLPFLPSGPDSEPVLLTDRQRQELAHIGARLRLRPRTVIYEQLSPARWVFVIAEGMVKSYRTLRSPKRAIAAFLGPRDLFGLAEKGKYVNTAESITRVTLYRLPVNELAILLKHDGDMQFAFLAKVTHELRESQRRATLLGRRDAAGRLAMFIAWMRDRADDPAIPLVPLPMTRSDIAGFLGLSLESVTRAAAELERRGLVAFESREGVRILEPARLARLVAAV